MLLLISNGYGRHCYPRSPTRPTEPEPPLARAAGGVVRTPRRVSVLVLGRNIRANHDGGLPRYVEQECRAYSQAADLLGIVGRAPR